MKRIYLFLFVLSGLLCSCDFNISTDPGVAQYVDVPDAFFVIESIDGYTVTIWDYSTAETIMYNFGDDEGPGFENKPEQLTIERTFTHTYERKGTYTIKAKAYLNGKTDIYKETITIQ